MHKPELLAPAGNFEALEAAIHGGADAIYVGLKNYGARAFANNFTDSEIVDAIKLCHTYGVKLYVTMNTLVKDSEVDDFIDKVRFLHESGIDAILIQDFGMMMLLREKFPKLEIHASTQFNNSSIDTVKLLKDIDVKRVVFSRELTLDEIKNIDVDIEKEVFVHGALCISYSGCCLFSSMYGNRSGNRGECVGCCRLPYKLQKNGKIIDSGYLLSTKELNTTNHIKELIDSGVDCLKIEGRMKSSSYVYFITKLYRNLIDNSDKVNIDKEEEKLKVLFNREFTSGHLFNKNNREIMNTTSPNHKGKIIGKVIGLEKDKIKIKLNQELNQEDGIRFTESNKGLIVNFLYDKNMKLVSSAKDICYVDNKIDLKTLDQVALTSSKKLEKELLNYPKKKIPVSFSLTAKVEDKLKLEVNDGKNSFCLSTITVEKAMSSPTSSDRIKEQLMKTGETPYLVTDINLDIDDNMFIPIKELNEMRRSVLDHLTELRCKVEDIQEEEVSFSKLDIKPTKFLTILVNTEKELLDAVNKYDRVYITKKDIFHKYKDKYKNIYYSGRRNLLEIEKESRNLTHEISYPTEDDICDYTCNAFNIYTVYYLHKLGYKCVTLSVELESYEIEDLLINFKNRFGFDPNVELFSYGRVELMIIKGDIFKENNNVELVDSKKRRFKILYEDGYTHIYDATIFDRLEFYKYNFKNVNLRIDKTFM